MGVQDVPLITVNQVTGPPADPETLQTDTAHQAQALSEGVDPPRPTVELLGMEFLAAEKVGLMPLLRFAHLAKRGVDTSDMDEDEMIEAMSSIYTMLLEVLHPDDHDAFIAHATLVHADMDDLMGGVGRAIELMTARPTQPRSGSSPSSPATGPTSTDARLRTLVPVDKALMG